jgi:hypothetical protein
MQHPVRRISAKPIINKNKGLFMAAILPNVTDITKSVRLPRGAYPWLLSQAGFHRFRTSAYFSLAAPGKGIGSLSDHFGDS